MGKARENEARAKRVVSACLKDHEKSMPTPLKFDRTCDFDIMTCVRKRRVACGAISSSVKIKTKHSIPWVPEVRLAACSFEFAVL